MVEESRQCDLLKFAQNAVGFQEVSSRRWTVFAWISPFVTTAQLLATTVNFCFKSGIYWTHLRCVLKRHLIRWQSAPEPPEASPRASAPDFDEERALRALLAQSWWSPPAVPHLTYHCACAQRWICLAMALCFLISWDIFISGLVLLSVSLLNSGDLFLISFCWL